MKKFLATLLMLSLMLTFAACATEPETPVDSETDSETQTETDTETETKKEEETMPPEVLERNTYKLATITDALKLYGRMSPTGTALSCDFAASGIEFNVYAQGFITLTVTHVLQTVENRKNDDVYLAVIVDGVLDTREFKVPKGGTAELKVAYFEEAGEHTIQILRKTEAKNGLLDLESLTLIGRLEDAPENADYYVEFIGDSITSGYGNLITNGTSNAGDADYKNALQAYAYLTAKALGADFQLISNSGIGLTEGYRAMLMPAFFGAESYYRSPSKAYAPTRTPDVVVINLGTNDHTKSADPTTFKNDVKTLIGNIRALYGEDVKIVWAHGMMKEGYISYVKEATAGMENFYTVELPKNTSAGGGHPNIATHKAAAEQLAEFIEDNVK
ncbi:MAG: hypothetical protein IJ011_04530 [Clostridia bacterium]|nr:hypothetical protein [Clostridia bacterium]